LSEQTSSSEDSESEGTENGIVKSASDLYGLSSRASGIRDANPKYPKIVFKTSVLGTESVSLVTVLISTQGKRLGFLNIFLRFSKPH
jgi:hypothetical protein